MTLLADWIVALRRSSDWMRASFNKHHFERLYNIYVTRSDI